MQKLLVHIQKGPGLDPHLYFALNLRNWYVRICIVSSKFLSHNQLNKI